MSPRSLLYCLVLTTRNVIETLHDRRLTLTRLPTHLGSPGVGIGTVCVLGKCVYLVTLAMSLFDLQDVCIAIGSLATLDLPMVVDLIGIYGLKGPYSTLTTTDWFLQALSVIPMGSWGDVARRFTMIRWVAKPPLSSSSTPPPPPCCRRKFVSGQLDEENPIVLISSGLLVQSDEGVPNLVVDRIDESTAINREAPGS
ncbi:plasma membrane ATPase 1-like [Dorcoceras hygrometricum]|uniref:Plasma membrane ATPase 1-like n=1 Tax=Dorcoceras hygrometricum TaxID=472368 RepID=A0A2Z7A4Y0_9LAMI|nr:plasma membrane ATPase 1-like [Dorcoceras hygrometricum]